MQSRVIQNDATIGKRVNEQIIAIKNSIKYSIIEEAAENSWGRKSSFPGKTDKVYERQ